MGVSAGQDQLRVRRIAPARMGGWSSSATTMTYDLDTAHFMGGGLGGSAQRPNQDLWRCANRHHVSVGGGPRPTARMGRLPDHYAEGVRPAKWPAPGHFSRRIRRLPCRHLLRDEDRGLAYSERSTPVSFIEARLLVVWPCSKDRRAKPGRVYGGFARGYKVHGIVTADGRMGWRCLTPLNASETQVGKVLVRRARWARGCWAMATMMRGRFTTRSLAASARC